MLFERSQCEYGDKLQFDMIVLPNFCISSRIPYNMNLRNLLTLNAVINNLRSSELYKVMIKCKAQGITAQYLIQPGQKVIKIV